MTPKTTAFLAVFALLLVLGGVLVYQDAQQHRQLPTSTPAAPATLTATSPPPTATAPPTPTPEAWQWCRVTASLRVRSGPSLRADVLRMLAVDDRVAIDANVRPVVADGYRWYPLVDGGWVADGWMECEQ